ncbi:MAG: site-specific integrase [Alphaproteobacteria bacterium]|nr:MAG: site-specific integrase [Alphaproteobacteria bacterium]
MAKVIQYPFGSSKPKAMKRNNIVWQSADGRITLFVRAGSKKQTIQYRISVPKAKGFMERRSTGCEKLEDAKRVALERFDHLSLLARTGKSLSVPTFEKVALEYIENLRQKVRNGTRKLSEYRLRDVERRLQNYLIPFFGDRVLDTISGHDVEGFYEFRRRIYEAELEIRENRSAIQKRGKKHLFYVVTDWVTKKSISRDFPKGKLPPLRAPRASTFQLDRNLVLSVYSFAKSSGYISHDDMIDIEKISYVGDRRGFFDDTTWQFFTSSTGKIARRRQTKFREGDGKRFAAHYYAAAMLHYWALLSAHTGLRPNEMKAIRYKDVSVEDFFFEKTQRDEPCAVLSVVPPYGSKGIKQRRRDAIGTYTRSAEYLNAIKQLRQEILVGVYGYPQEPDPAEYLFQPILRQHDKRQKVRTAQYEGLAQTLRHRLEELDILKDAEGRDRSAYSFRHTYATFRMKNGADYMALALQMGTSVQRIKDTYAHVTTRDNVARVNVVKLQKPLV